MTRILIVEDDALIAADLDGILEDAGYEVVGIAADMHSALEIAARIAVDIAIMDISLALGTNGIETARRLREQHNVPSLFVSAQISEQAKAMALEWRPIGFIAKPYRPAAILQALTASA